MTPAGRCPAPIYRELVPQLSPWLEGRNHIHPAVHRVQNAIAADPTKTWTLAAFWFRIIPPTPQRLGPALSHGATPGPRAPSGRLRFGLLAPMDPACALGENWTPNLKPETVPSYLPEPDCRIWIRCLQRVTIR